MDLDLLFAGTCAWRPRLGTPFTTSVEAGGTVTITSGRIAIVDPLAPREEGEGLERAVPNGAHPVDFLLLGGSVVGARVCFSGAPAERWEPAGAFAIDTGYAGFLDPSAMYDPDVAIDFDLRVADLGTPGVLAFQSRDGRFEASWGVGADGAVTTLFARFLTLSEPRFDAALVRAEGIGLGALPLPDELGVKVARVEVPEGFPARGPVFKVEPASDRRGAVHVHAVDADERVLADPESDGFAHFTFDYPDGKLPLGTSLRIARDTEDGARDPIPIALV